MVTKTYKITGMQRAFIKVVVHDYKKGITFDNFEPLDCTCKYSTSNDEVQRAIEAHPWFCKGIIKLFRTTGGEVEEPKNDDCTKTEPTRSMPRVKSVNSAVNILVTQFGCEMEEVDTREKMLAKAEELGVSFPNLK